MLWLHILERLHLKIWHRFFLVIVRVVVHQRQQGSVFVPIAVSVTKRCRPRVAMYRQHKILKIIHFNHRNQAHSHFQATNTSLQCSLQMHGLFKTNSSQIQCHHQQLTSRRLSSMCSHHRQKLHVIFLRSKPGEEGWERLAYCSSL